MRPFLSLWFGGPGTSRESGRPGDSDLENPGAPGDRSRSVWVPRGTLEQPVKHGRVGVEEGHIPFPPPIDLIPIALAELRVLAWPPRQEHRREFQSIALYGLDGQQRVVDRSKPGPP